MNIRTSAGLTTAAAALLLLWAACASVSDGEPSDAGVPTDATGMCALSISYDNPMPVEAGALVAAQVFVTESGAVDGARLFEWSVLRDGATELTPETLNPSGSSASFPVGLAGNYAVSVSGTIGGVQCTGASDTLTVYPPNANQVSYRFRFVPRQNQAAPVQEQVIAVWGGVDAYIDEVSMQAGSTAAGMVVDAAKAPLSAYLRATPLGGIDPFPIETFADSAGEFGVRVSAQFLYDVLVVPDSDAAAPMIVPGVVASQLDTVTVDQGDAITGVVLDTAGAPVAGARVSARVGDVPSTIATTDAAGVFALHARFAAGPAASITVVPPAGSGLPRLELPATAGYAASAAAVTIRYASSLSSRSVDVIATLANGSTPAPGARVTWVARPITAVGTVTALGGPDLSAAGSARMTAVAGVGGVVPTTVLPDAIYDVIVEPADGAPAAEGVSLAAMDLSLGNPSPPLVSLAARSTVTGSIVDSDQVGLVDVRVTAIPAGVLAGTTASSDTVVSAADGSYSLSLVGNGDYTLIFDATDRRHARANVVVVAPAAGAGAALSPTALGDAVRIHGRVKIGSAPAGGVTVRLYCLQCSATSAMAPLAEAVSASNGDFVIAVPDPGVTE